MVFSPRGFGVISSRRPAGSLQTAWNSALRKAFGHSQNAHPKRTPPPSCLTFSTTPSKQKQYKPNRGSGTTGTSTIGSPPSEFANDRRAGVIPLGVVSGIVCVRCRSNISVASRLISANERCERLINAGRFSLSALPSSTQSPCVDAQFTDTELVDARFRSVTVCASVACVTRDRLGYPKLALIADRSSCGCEVLR
jgi:hypothetical protein